MNETSKEKKVKNPDYFEDDFEATEVEIKGVAYTGLSVLIIVLGLIGAAFYALW